VEISEQKDGSIFIGIRVQPRASRNAISLDQDGHIRVVLTAAPVEGAANKAVTKLIADALGVPKSAVTVAKGEKSREKVIAVTGISADQAHMRLEKASQPSKR